MFKEDNLRVMRLMPERVKLREQGLLILLERQKSIDVMVKLLVIEQPIFLAPPADSTAQVFSQWDAVYDAHNEELKSLFGKQVGVGRFDLIQTFHACKQEEGKPVGPYVIRMKNYVAQQERLGNYNMHNIRKTIGELHALLIEYEKGKGKGKGKEKDKSYIPKPNNPKPPAKEHLTKDNVCHHYKEVGNCKRNCFAYLAGLIKKKKQLTPPYTPQHNGVSKRKNRTLLDMVDKTPNELSYGKVPNLSYLKVWGCEKNLKSQEVSGGAEELEEIQDKDTSPSKNTSEIPMEVEGYEPPQKEVIPIHRSTRTHRAPNILCLNLEVENHSLGDLNEPNNYKAAILYPKFDKWVDAMNAKMQSMKDNQVWCLVDLPPNCKIIGSNWIFKKKTDMDDIVHSYKAHLVAKGFTQTYEVGYEETFSPVANIRAIRILIATEMFYDYEIWQIDVKTAFLNGYLNVDIYMVRPEGFVDPNHPRLVCKLQRSIYGLKQESRSWNKRFDEGIKRFGFAQNLDEPCVYQNDSGSNVTFLILYVDDIIIMGNHIPSLQSVKSYRGKFSP
uniref:Retrotransposon protein, putative, Ty1-copia subclass n=1 Tax=Tanacetum cinerariifolium TaxID=118510 RepID=A0A6L2K3G9_TANCI|nr:retrotransposon protein, putative, Ty1-copia subclass [Tanacetum cinerariifolium]